MSKGVSPIIAMIFLVMISIALVAATFMFFTNMEKSYKNATEQQSSKTAYELGENFKIENVVGNKVYIKNTGTVALKGLTLYVNDARVASIPSGLVPGSSDSYDYTTEWCVKNTPRQIRVTGQKVVKEVSYTPPTAYCINITHTSLFENGKSYILFNGQVYLNDEAQTPYDKKNISYSLEQIETGYQYPGGNATTDSSGGFTLKKEWNFTALFPNTWWAIPYEYEWTAEFWSKSSEIPQTTQPSWIVSANNVNTTLNRVQLKLLPYVYSKATINKYITPLEVASDHARFNITLELNVSGPTIQNGADGWIGMALDENLSTGAQVQCFNASIAACHTVIGRVELTGAPMNGLYPDVKNSTLEFNVTNFNTEPMFVMLQPVHISKNIDGQWRKVLTYLSSEPVKLMPGEKKTLHIFLDVTQLSNNIKDQFKDNSNNRTNGTYMIESYIYVPSYMGLYGLNYTRIFINSTILSPLSIWQNAPKNITLVSWNFSQTLTSGMFNFSFTVNYSRGFGNSVTNHSAWAEFLYFFNSTGHTNFTASYTYSNIGSSLSKNRGDAYAISVPDINAVYPNTLGAYTTLQIKSTENIGSSSVKMKVRSVTYLMNFDSSDITNVLVYKKRGILNSSDWQDVRGNFNYSYVVDNTPPGPDETRSNYIEYKIGSGSYDYIDPNISISINRQFWRNDSKLNMSCSGSGCHLYYPNNDAMAWEEVTGMVGSSAVFNATFSGNPGNGGASTGRGVKVQPWVQYTKTAPMWQNRASYHSVFWTAQPDPYPTSSYDYDFIS